MCGLGLLAQDRAVMEALVPQDYLYSLLEQDGSTQQLRVIGSLLDYVHAPSNPAAALARLSAPETRIVTLTITEGGYYLNQGTGELDAYHPNLKHDLAHCDLPPISVWGYLAAALDKRRRAGLAPFTVQSCDNLQANGAITRRMLTSFARLYELQLGRWLEAHGAFPNSMVDRITPVTDDVLRGRVRQQLGDVEDCWPVMSETFRQWVIEDEFVQGRPAWQDVGALLTHDVEPYERMKIYLLNGSHQALCYAGVLMGYQTVDAAIGDPAIRRLVERYMNTVSCLIMAPAGIDLTAYQHSVIARFENAAIGDTLARICFDASSRIPKFVLPMLRQQILRGGDLSVFAFVIASWIRYLGGEDEQGRPIEVKDPMVRKLKGAAPPGCVDPQPMLAIAEIFDSDLLHSKDFVLKIQTALGKLNRTDSIVDILCHLVEP